METSHADVEWGFHSHVGVGCLSRISTPLIALTTQLLKEELVRCNKIQSKCLTSTYFGRAAVLLLTVGPLRALTPVTACGQTLDVAGGKYILTVDLDCSGTFANGINMTASSVFFHLAGHAISSTDCDGSKVSAASSCLAEYRGCGSTVARSGGSMMGLSSIPQVPE
jgi:hypothetical protein